MYEFCRLALTERPRVLMLVLLLTDDLGDPGQVNVPSLTLLPQC